MLGRWLAAAWAAWALALVVDLTVHQLRLSSLGAVTYLLELSGLLAVMGSAPLAIVHGLRVVADARGRSGTGWSSLLVGLALLYPAWDQASFLTAGDGISTSPWLWPVRLSVFAGVLSAGLALWRWHLVFVTAKERRRRLYLSALALGLLVVGGLLAMLGRELRAYTYLARSLLLVAWMCAATCAYAAARRWPGWLSLAWLVVGLATVAVGRTATKGAVRARNTLMRDSQLVVLTDMAVRDRDTSAASLDVSLPQRFECAPRPPLEAPPPLALDPKQRRNVILISFDALRADAIGMRATRDPGKPAKAKDEKPPARKPELVMPHLTRFAAESIYYERAVTPYPATLMAVGGALTGLSPSDILFAPERPKNVFTRTRHRFDRSFIGLPRSRWFELPIIDALFIQGTATMKRHDARSQTSWLLRGLRKARRDHKSVFAWLHYFEPHGPYRSHPGLRFGDGITADYTSELAYVDREFGRLVRYLKRAKWFDDSLVIVFSDHGEALGERRYIGHHVYLNSWITDIPLMLRVPGQPPARTDEMADLTDIAPTVLHFANVPYAPESMAGRSLLAPSGPGAARKLRFAEAFPARGHQLFDITNRPITSWEALEERMELAHRGARNYLPKVAVVSAERRLIVNRVTGVTELYDRTRDRAETHDLSASEPQRVRQLLAALGSWSREQSERIYCAVKRAQAKRSPEAPAGPTPDAGLPVQPTDSREQPAAATRKPTPQPGRPGF